MESGLDGEVALFFSVCGVNGEDAEFFSHGAAEMDLIAVLACTLFTGAALYINLVEHPARLEAGPHLALQQFAPSYRRATITQVSLACIATLSGLAHWFRGGAFAWLFAAILIFSVMPYTVLFMFPTNRKLIDPATDPESPETQALLHRWARLHAVRTALSMAASLLMIWLILHP